MNEKLDSNFSLFFDLPCVILSGGKSSRMGRDKSLLNFKNSNSLIQYQYNRLKPYFKEIYISSKVDKFDFECNIIYDKEEVYSPMVALKSIMNEIKEKEVFLITVDTPLVEINSIKRIIEEKNNYDICVAKTEKIHNLCGVFSTNLKDKIEKNIKQDIHKIGYLLKSSKTNYINFYNNKEFININTPDEYDLALKI